MTSEEFNEIINELILGIPVGLAMTRLALALSAVVVAGGEAADKALRDFATSKRGTGDNNGS